MRGGYERERGEHVRRNFVLNVLDGAVFVVAAAVALAAALWILLFVREPRRLAPTPAP